jgi:hypothetical protein
MSFAVTISAQVAVAPLLIPMFGPMPLVSLPANVLAEPAAALVMMWGSTGGVIAGLVGDDLASIVHLPTRLGLWWVMTVSRIGASVPAASVGFVGGALIGVGVIVIAVVRRIAITRWMMAALTISIAAIVGWVFYTPIITNLAKPVCDLKSAQESGADNCGALYINGVLGPLNLHIKVAILTGLLLAAPIWLYQLWAFIAPALHKREKRNSVLFIIAATPFFSVGAYFGYTILPMAIRVLFGFTPDALNNLVKFDDYLDHVNISPTHRYFISKYSAMPWRDPSRPSPDCLTPPKGTCSVAMMPTLMPTIPYSKASLTR